LSGTAAGRARLENVEPLKKNRGPTLLDPKTFELTNEAGRKEASAAA
jgi:hypothetical protein